MKQLKRGELRAWRIATLAAQGNVSSLSGLPIPEGAAVVDHCHQTGQIRGVISRAENSVLGKLERGRRWGRELNVVAFAAGVHRYLCVRAPHPLYPAPPKKRKKVLK